MSEQSQRPVRGHVQEPVTGQPADLIEKSLSGSSYSEVVSIQTTDESPEQFLGSDDD